MRRTLFAILLVLGCGRGLHPESPASAPEGIVELARTRPIPARLQARLSLTVTADGRGTGTNGFLVVDRPGRGHFAVLGLLGGPVLTLTTDGTAVAVALPREQRFLVADSAAGVLAELSGGAASPDDLLAALTGDLPFDGVAPKAKRKLDNGDVVAVLAGPLGWDATATLTPDGGMRELSLGHGGTTSMIVRYEPYALVDAGGVQALLPTAAEVELPQQHLTVAIRYRGWKIPDPLPPVFDVAPPAGEQAESLADFVRNLGLMALFRAAGDD